jgi:hypothetical protein
MRGQKPNTSGDYDISAMIQIMKKEIFDTGDPIPRKAARVVQSYLRTSVLRTRKNEVY